MRIIIKNGNSYEFQNIPENMLSTMIDNNDEIITEFETTETEARYLDMGYAFTYEDETFTFTNLATIEAIEAEGIKQTLIDEAKRLKAEGVANLGAYRAQETIPSEDDPNKQTKLDLLESKGQAITTEYLTKEAYLISEYGIEILEELI